VYLLPNEQRREEYNQDQEQREHGYHGRCGQRLTAVQAGIQDLQRYRVENRGLSISMGKSKS